MKTRTHDLSGPRPRAWLAFGFVSLMLPISLAVKALWLVNPGWASTLDTLGHGMSLLALAGGGLLASLATQPRRRGQTTFERIHSLAEPRRPTGGMLPRLGGPGLPPRWLARWTRRLTEPFSAIERGAFVIITLGALIFLYAPESWLIRSAMATWLPPRFLAPVLFGLIGVITVLSLRLTAQVLEVPPDPAETAPPAASGTSPGF